MGMGLGVRSAQRTKPTKIGSESMKTYLAARFSKRHEPHSLGKQLQELGHEKTSRWSLPDSDHVTPVGMSEQAADAERTRFALEDIRDVMAADCCISIMEEPRNNSRGGRHVEFGFALARGYRMIIVGPRETVFHHLPQVEHFDTHVDLVAAMQKEAK